MRLLKLLNFIRLILTTCFFGSQFCNALHSVQLITQFPNGSFLENLAVRNDGSIVVNFITSSDVYLIQPSAEHANPRLVHTFEGSTSVIGFAEVAPDSFVVTVTSLSGLGQSIPGSSSLWRIDFERPFSEKAKVTQVTKLPKIGFPNGLAKMNENKVLLADSTNGVVDVVDVQAGTFDVALTDTLLARTSGPLGVNGIRIRGDDLYFTNPAQNLFGRLPLDLKTGAARGPANTIFTGPPSTAAFDDFALSESGVAFLASAFSNVIERVNVRTKREIIVAGNLNSTVIAEPTSAAFGRNGKEDMLFVTTGGGHFIPVDGNEIIGAQLLAIKLEKKYIASSALSV